MIFKNKNKEEYNEIPVYYCKDCLSLDIRDLDNYDYCNKCGSTNISAALIEDWEEMYFTKYKRKLINNIKKH